MYSNKKIAVIIPALNEEEALPLVIRDIPEDIVDEIIVVDNGSTDRTFSAARENGATALREGRRGYGYACLKGIEYAKEKTPDIVVFLDGDHSDYPEEMIYIIKPIIEEGYDMVIGSRVLGGMGKDVMPPQAYYGTRFGAFLIKLLFGFSYTDFGPFRAIRFDRLLDLGMQDKTYGWTVEMQIKAVKEKYKIKEVPVSYRARVGKSKISGTLKGTIMASCKILLTILKGVFPLSQE